MNTKRREYLPIWTNRSTSPLFSLHRQLSDIFGDIFEGFDSTGQLAQRTGGFYPKSNVVDGEDALRVSLEVPGVDPHEIEISLTKDAITFRGEKKDETTREEGTYKLVERSYGSFSRSIPLEFPHDTDKVDAVFDKGVLTVTIPKLKPTKDETKKVSIRTL